MKEVAKRKKHTFISTGMSTIDDINKAVKIFNDTKNVKSAITEWIHKWKKNGWKTASKKPVKNKDLWKELDYLVKEHIIDWEWVRGHSGNPGNEKADQLANKGILEYLERQQMILDCPKF